MHSPIRVAVLGYGLAGRVFHCPFISAIPGLRLEAIVQRTGDTAAETYPTARVLRTPEAAINDPEIDLIVVATPNDTHEPLARAALAAGKHVIVDKPLAPTSAAVRELIATAHAAGRHLIPFHNRRWDGDFLTLQSLLRDGTLGRPVKFISHMDRFRPLRREGTWKEHPGPSHGLLQDLAPHLLDQALTLFGTPTHLTADIRHDRDQTDIEDAFDITLHYTQGPTGKPLATTSTASPATGHQPPATTHLPPATGHVPPATPHPLTVSLHATMLAADPAPRFRMHGTRGSYTKHGLDLQEPHLVADGRHPPTLGSSVPWLEEPEKDWGCLTLCPDPAQPNHLTRTALPTHMGDYRLFYAGVLQTLTTNTPPPVPATAALYTAQLIELARQSSQERRTLEVHLG